MSVATTGRPSGGKIMAYRIIASGEFATMTTDPRLVRLVRIFVSSPGDVAEERAVLSEVVDRINQTAEPELGVRLELIRWEDGLVPQIGPSPQAVVDAQLPPQYDVYLGLMKHRFGTPAGRYGSGTEKEFRDALKNWGAAGTPWILFYFCTAPVDPFAIDLDQLAQVRKFRELVEKRGLYATYDAVRGAKTAFFDQVELHLRKLLSLLPQPAGEKGRTPPRPTPGPPTVPAAYRQWLRRRCADIDLLGLQLKEGRSLRLNNVYVPLTTAAAAEPPAGRRPPPGAEPPPRQLLLSLLDRESLYVSGAPGSGKSVFCRWVAWLSCEGRLPDRAVPDPDEFREAFPEGLRTRLPVLVRLRDFWETLAGHGGRQDLSGPHFEQALAAWLQAAEPDGLSADGLRTHLAHGAALLIFDGVDEVPISQETAGPTWYPRPLLLSGLSEAVAAWSRAGNRVLVTSRPYGLTDAERQRLGLRHAPIDDLPEALQELLVRRWFHVLSEDRAAAEAYTRDMIDHVRARPGLDQLVTNPMLLTAACILYHEGKRLPQDKHELYARIVDNVLYNRFKDPALIDRVRNRLCVVAHGMHTGAGLGDERAAPRPLATFDEINRMLEAYRQKSRYTDAGYQDVVAVREQLLSQTGLLLPREHERAAFYHLSIQEFLAAQRVWDLDSDHLADFFRRRSGHAEWHNTLSFLFAAQHAKSSDPDRSIRLVETLIGHSRPDDWGLHVVVGDCLQMLLGKGLRLQPAPEERFKEACLAAIRAEAPLRERNLLALTLGHLGDPRIVTDLRQREAYVEIPAGKYRVGDNDKGKYDKNWPPLPAETFHLKQPLLLSRFPVTNAQYALFMADGGYEREEFWSKEGWSWRQQNQEITAPRLWRNVQWNAPNQPVVRVTYWEGEAFCRWAGGRLPSEREWEAAARGPEGCVYPWGDAWVDGICNSSEAGLGVTTPVGIFPRSRSAAFGLEDMAGNVFEWCADVHERYGGHVIRGGSWAYTAAWCRCAARSYDPYVGWIFDGFRVART